MRGIGLAISLAALVAAFTIARPAQTPGPVFRDFEAYYAAGASWNSGADPYSAAIWQSERTIPGVDAKRFELLPFVGPPFTIPVWSLFAKLKFPLAAALWGILLLAAGGTLVWCSLRLSGAGDNATVTAAAILALSFGPLTSALALGQVTLFASAGAVAACALVASRRSIAAGASMLAAFFQPNLIAPLLSTLRSASARAPLAIAVLLAGALSIAFAGIAAVGAYARVLRDHTRAEQNDAIQFTVSSVLHGFGAAPAIATAIAITIGVCALFLLVWVFRDKNSTLAAGFGATAAALPFIGNFFHEHNFALAYFPMVFCLRRCTGAAWAVAAFASITLSVDWLGFAQRPNGLVQAVLLVTAASGAIAALHPAGRRFPFWLYASIPAVAAIAFWAAQHPQPVWPDALPVHWDFRHDASAATVWHAEQEEAGLLAAHPLSALLRSLPLLDSAALVVLCARYRRS